MFASSMKPLVNLEERIGKVVGRRSPAPNTLELTKAQRKSDSIAWRKAKQGLGVPKGVYRFKTHEEADEWLWRMLTNRR
jgi:hypothetical protein